MAKLGQSDFRGQLFNIFPEKEFGNEDREELEINVGIPGIWMQTGKPFLCSPENVAGIPTLSLHSDRDRLELLLVAVLDCHTYPNYFRLHRNSLPWVYRQSPEYLVCDEKPLQTCVGTLPLSVVCSLYKLWHSPSLGSSRHLECPFNCHHIRRESWLSPKDLGLILSMPLTSWMEPGAGYFLLLGFSFLVCLWGTRLSPLPTFQGCHKAQMKAMRGPVLGPWEPSETTQFSPARGT